MHIHTLSAKESIKSFTPLLPVVTKNSRPKLLCDQTNFQKIFIWRMLLWHYHGEGENSENQIPVILYNTFSHIRRTNTF